MRIQVSNLSCLAFVCCLRQEDLEDVRNLCGANAALLRANPLGLLSIIFDHRARSWEAWVTRLWLQVNQIEGLTRSVPQDWLMKDPVSILQQSVGSTTLSPASAEPSRHHTMSQLTMDPMPTALTALELQDFESTPFHDLGNTEELLPRLYTTDTEISHGQNVMSFAIRYADFCLDAVNVVDSARMSVGLPPQTPGAKALVADRIRFTKSRCLALQDRFAEIRERHRSQINAVSLFPGSVRQPVLFPL
ncbi:hypothetical protein GE09DRAFT_1109444 [Coniochaeta sp. 2T2.1]|nr:hypothetical protein GE09DRAFT_1109444 [Coniochaeta sp. 2T2.1]